jgi:hypothetical protein
MAHFDVYQSDDLKLAIDVAMEGVTDTTTESNLVFLVMPAPGLADSRAVITKAGGDITPVPPKTFRWDITAEDTAALTVDKQYYWYVRYIDNDGGRHTIDEGTIKLVPGVKVA